MEYTKKIMLLGGLRYLIPVIETAHRLGYYVITCDYLPDNIAHKYSDEYCNVSIIDKDAVLEVAKEKGIDGIMSFAVDPGVVTAAYVQEKLGLPGNPYESVCILQNKDRFRKFLSDNGFNAPEAFGFASFEEAVSMSDAFRYPVIVKPTDAAGSKGVTRVDAPAELGPALTYAFKYSISGKVIVEQFIEKVGCSSDSDSFSVDGSLDFVTFSAQRFDASASNPYTPSAYSWPSTMSSEEESYLKGELQRLISLLGMKTSIYNIETRVGSDGKPYIMEVSPRGGGNRLSEMIHLASGTNLIENAVRAAVGDELLPMQSPVYDGFWAEVILHADNDGIFDALEVAEDVRPYVVETDLWVSKGDAVSRFDGANNAIGTLVLRFDSAQKMEKCIADTSAWLKIKTA